MGCYWRIITCHFLAEKNVVQNYRKETLTRNKDALTRTLPCYLPAVEQVTDPCSHGNVRPYLRAQLMQRRPNYSQHTKPRASILS